MLKALRDPSLGAKPLDKYANLPYPYGTSCQARVGRVGPRSPRGFNFMTVAPSTPINTYTGDGATNSYPFTFEVFLQTQLDVIVVAPDATVYTLDLGTDYTVSGLSPTGGGAMPGSITLVNSGQAWLTSGNLTTDYILTIERTLPIAQTYSIRNQGDYYPEFLENALDYIVMLIQQNENNQLVLTDTVTGRTYQLLMVNGVLSTQEIG